MKNSKQNREHQMNRKALFANATERKASNSSQNILKILKRRFRIYLTKSYHINRNDLKRSKKKTTLSLFENFRKHSKKKAFQNQTFLL